MTMMEIKQYSKKKVGAFFSCVSINLPFLPAFSLKREWWNPHREAQPKAMAGTEVVAALSPHSLCNWACGLQIVNGGVPSSR